MMYVQGLYTNIMYQSLLKDGGRTMLFADLPLMKYLANIVDILLVWYVIYKLIMIVRGTKAVQLLKGIFVILLVRLVSEFFHLQTFFWITEQVYFGVFWQLLLFFNRKYEEHLNKLGEGRFSPGAAPGGR